MTAAPTPDYPRFQAYAEQVNLELFNAAIQLAASTTPDTKQISVLEARLGSHIWYERTRDSQFFESHDLRYFGELLERHEEKLGAETRNHRAVALALAYAAPVLADSMFVGRQRGDFMKRLRQAAPGDLYLTGALYLLSKDETERDRLKETLLHTEYTRTEESLFALSVVEDSFTVLRPQLARLLGGGRTMTAEGNAGLYAWFLAEYRSQIRECRKSDNAILRALLRLSEAYVRPNHREYAVLTGAGYSQRDVVVLNELLLWEHRLRDRISPDSIPGERLAAAFALTLLNGEEPPSDALLEFLRWLLTTRYACFEIKYEENHDLWCAVKDHLNIACPDTLIWMIQNLRKNHPYRFDVLDDRWDVLAARLPGEPYHELFRIQLLADRERPRDEAIRMLDKYQALTGQPYAAAFETFSYEESGAFSYLVSLNVLTLWDFFDGHSASAAKTANHGNNTLRYVWDLVAGVTDKAAYDFWQRFFDSFTVQDVLRFWPGKEFHEPFMRRPRHYYLTAGEIDYLRVFLSREENRRLYEWIDCSVFTLTPSQYGEFVRRFLQADATRRLYDLAELRPVYQALLQRFPDDRSVLALETRYLTQEELAMKKAAEQAAAIAKKQAERERQRREISEKADAAFDGTLQSLQEFIRGMMTWNGQRELAAACVHRRMPQYLAGRVAFSQAELGCLLTLYSYFVQYGLAQPNEVSQVLMGVQIAPQEKEVEEKCC